MTELVRIYNAGHGGGFRLLPPPYGGQIYLTAGKQSPEVPPGIYEGVFNRKVTAQCARMDEMAGHYAVDLAPGPVDIRKKDRTDWANKMITQAKVMDPAVSGGLWLGIHANAARARGWSGAHGMTVWAYPSVESRILAQCIIDECTTQLDGLVSIRGIKESRWFHELRKPKMPSVIVECGFMTNKGEAAILATRRAEIFIASGITTGAENAEKIILLWRKENASTK